MEKGRDGWADCCVFQCFEWKKNRVGKLWPVTGTSKHS
jgi:hypothetical protein